MHNQKNTVPDVNEQIVFLCLLQRHRILAIFCARKPHTNPTKIWKDVVAVALSHMHPVKKSYASPIDALAKSETAGYTM
jgi:hypothetical protein